LVVEVVVAGGGKSGEKPGECVVRSSSVWLSCCLYLSGPDSEAGHASSCLPVPVNETNKV